MAEMGNIQGASECYDKAIKADPKYGPSYFNKGVLLDKLQDHEEALEFLRQSNNSRSKKTKCSIL